MTETITTRPPAGEGSPNLNDALEVRTGERARGRFTNRRDWARKTRTARRGFTAVAAIMFCAAATLIPATPASALGRYGTLTARWWSWVSARPAVDVGGTNTYPILDSTGAYAAVGQENGIGPGHKYFFLAGGFGGDVARTVTVPAGKALFFPIANVEVDNAVDPPTNLGPHALRVLAKAPIDALDPTCLYARFDGEPVEMFRTTSPTFSYTLPEENSIYDYFGLVGPQFEGRIKPAVADGYWASIPPPAAGQHLLEFGTNVDAEVPCNDFQLTVTYDLTID